MAALKIWYDHEGDFMEVMFEDAPTSLEEVADDVFERRTTDGRVIGFVVFNFSKHDRDNLTLPLSVKALPAAAALKRSAGIHCAGLTGTRAVAGRGRPARGIAAAAGVARGT